MYRQLALLCFFFWITCPFAKAQQLYFKHFAVDDGLPSNEVYQVVEDDRGNLLAATDRGAVRFDGYSFTDLKLEKQLTSLPVYYIYKSPIQKIYYSTLQGAIYRYGNDTLHSFAHSDQAASLFSHPGILIANTISEKTDTLWISYNNDFNYNYKVGSCFVTPKGQVRKLDHPDGIYFDLPHRFYFRQLSASKYNAATQTVHITWPDGSATTDTVAVNWRGGYIRRLYYESFDNLHLFSIGQRLLVYRDRKRIASFTFPENVLYLAKAKDSDFYIGFENIGAIRYTATDGKVSGTGERLLDGFSVTSIYKDRQNGTWFSTLENGLFYAYPSTARFWDNDSKIVSIQHRKNRVYVGNYSGLIRVYEKGLPVAETRLPIGNGSYLSRLSFAANDSLIAITEKGFYSKEAKGWRFHASQDALILPVNDRIIYGASAPLPELHVYDKLGEEAVGKLELSKRVISLFSDSRRQLWIGTWEGLLLYANRKLIDLGKKSAVFRDRIVAIEELPDKSLVVASLGNGLAVCKANQIFTLNTGNGLLSPVINSMVIDKDDIWIGTNKGLSKVNFINGNFKIAHFGIESGLPTADIHEFSVRDSLLYIKWINRLVVANLETLLRSDTNTQTYLTALHINDEAPAPFSDRSFTHKQNTLTFGFTCPNLAAAAQQEYLYFMDGFDKSWHSTKERYVKYTNLPAGRYVFKVQALSLRDRTPSSIAQFAFTIKPAFWQTWWFDLLAALAVISFILSVFRQRLNAINRKNQLVLELAENRQKVLTQLIHPHFVFNVLNTIQGAILKQDKMAAASVVAKFAKLMRLSMELSKEKMVRLEKEIELLQKYFELEEIRSPGRFTYEIEVAPPLRPSAVFIPSMLIQPFVENSIKHGIMHLQNKKGQIRIRFVQQNGDLLCTVDDNGVGRQQSERINRSNRQDHFSSGIEITVDRLALLHKERNTAFLYQVKDKQAINGAPEGTTIIFSIPYLHVQESDPRADH